MNVPYIGTLIVRIIFMISDYIFCMHAVHIDHMLSCRIEGIWSWHNKRVMNLEFWHLQSMVWIWSWRQKQVFAMPVRCLLQTSSMRFEFLYTLAYLLKLACSICQMYGQVYDILQPITSATACYKRIIVRCTNSKHQLQDGQHEKD